MRATVIAVPKDDGTLAPLACFVVPDPSEGWQHAALGPWWRLESGCTSYMAQQATRFGTGADALVVLAPDERARARVTPAAALTRVAPEPDIAKALERLVGSTGSYAGQGLEVTLGQAVEVDLNGDGVGDRLYPATSFANEGEGHQGDGGVWWADGRKPTKLVPLSTALSDATIVAVSDLDHDRVLEVIIHHATPTGRSVVMAGLSAVGWMDLGGVGLDDEGYEGVDDRPLPVPMPAPAPAEGGGGALTTDGLATLQSALGVAAGATRDAVRARFGPPLERDDADPDQGPNDLVYLDGDLVFRFSRGADARLVGLDATIGALGLARLRDVALGPLGEVLARGAKDFAQAMTAKVGVGGKRAHTLGWDARVPDSDRVVSLALAECEDPADRICHVSIGWSTARTIGPRAQFFGLMMLADEVAVAKASGVSGTSDPHRGTTFTWADGTLVARVVDGRLATLTATTDALVKVIGKASPGPFGTLGGDLAHAEKVLGAADDVRPDGATWFVPNGGARAFTFTLECPDGRCTKATVDAVAR